MRAVWKRDSGWPEPAGADAVIDDLAELPALIARFSRGALTDGESGRWSIGSATIRAAIRGARNQPRRSFP
jgi:hypothetical protein